MAPARLSVLDQDFYSLLIRQSDDQLRLLALAACQFAVRKAGLKYPAIDNALRTLTDRQPLVPAEADELAKLVMALDATQKEITDRVHLGRTSVLSGKAATCQARAANAVYLAASEDPLYAALEAVYEAYVASEDWPGLKSILLDKLRKK
jgi:hypothetical protein